MQCKTSIFFSSKVRHDQVRISISKIFHAYLEVCLFSNVLLLLQCVHVGFATQPAQGPRTGRPDQIEECWSILQPLLVSLFSDVLLHLQCNSCPVLF